MAYIISPENPNTKNIIDSMIKKLDVINPISPYSVASPFLLDSITPMSPLNYNLMSPLSPNSLIYSDTYNTYGNINTPYIPSVNLSFSNPTFGFYENLNLDPQIHKTLTKYFYYKTLDKWLYSDLIDVLNYLKYDKGKVTYLNKITDLDLSTVDKETNTEIDAKVDFIEKHVLNKKMMHHILQKCVNETNIRWVDLPKNEYYVKQFIDNKLKRVLKNTISGK